MSHSPAPVDQVKATGRLVELDRVRGLAIVLMILDHLAYIAGPVEIRMTLGRLAMPLFMVLAGGLFTRITRRHATAVVLGAALTVVAPWAGEPNILIQYVFGAVMLMLARWAELSPWLLVVLGGVSVANGWSEDGWSYEQVGIFILMGAGAAMGTGWAVALGRRIPGALARVGAAPLRWYVGNVLVIQGVIWWLSKA